MRLNFVLSIAAAVLLLAACSSDQNPVKPAGPSGFQQTQPAPVTGAQIVPGSQADLVANVGDRLFFDYDKSDLRADARAQVDKWAQWLKKYPQNTVTIEGHCDERGTREYNLALGKERPAVVGSNEAAWAQNRRDVMVVN